MLSPHIIFFITSKNVSLGNFILEFYFGKPLPVQMFCFSGKEEERHYTPGPSPGSLYSPSELLMLLLPTMDPAKTSPAKWERSHSTAKLLGRGENLNRKKRHRMKV